MTFGIVAFQPETGYGYIRRGEGRGEDGGAYPVAEFIEKPPLDLATQFVASGDYYWNSGMFVFTAARFLEELRAFAPDILEAVTAAYRAAKSDLDFVRIDKKAFERCRGESIDYAVMEKTKDALVVPLDAGWSDVGSWSSLFDALPADEDGNVLQGDVLVYDTHDCYVHSTSRLVAAVGMDDHIVVETKDAVLVAPKERVHDVKELVNLLKKSGRPESAWHREVFRPWGSYDSIDAGRALPGQAPDRQARRGAVLANASSPRRALDHRLRHRKNHARRGDVLAVGERIHVHSDRHDASDRKSRQAAAALDRSPVRLLSGRGRYCALRGQLRPRRHRHVKPIACFKAYDLRGRIPTDLNEDVAYRVGRGYAQFLSPRRVVVGRDIRLSSAALTDALCRGLADSGVDVDDIGLCGTEGVYFATFNGGYDGGIMVTASHNPPDYNGMKFVREQSKPISGDNGLQQIREFAERGEFPIPAHRGVRRSVDINDAYVAHLLSYVDLAKLKPLKIVVNAGNGGAGLIIDRLEPHLPFRFVKVHHAPDGLFPNGIPNPMLEENRQPTVAAIRREGADFGIAWDGDFDRCFLFDEHGGFIEGYYIVGLLASVLLRGEPGGKVVHDPRLTWNTLELVRAAGGSPVQSKSGHAFIKQVMREVDGVYGGEMSAHHYFRRFAYCDSGMIPWLIVAQLLSETGRPLSELVGARMRAFPASGELNYRVPDAKAAIAAIEARYAPGADNSRSDGRRVVQLSRLALQFAQLQYRALDPLERRIPRR